MDRESTRYQAEKLCNYFNECLLADQQSVTSLFNTQIKCNDLLCNHPSIIIADRDGEYYLTPLGLINGVLGTNRIARNIENGLITGFKVSPF